MDVDEVERLVAQQPPQAQGGGQVMAGARREGEHLDLDPEPADLLDLVAHPLTPLRRRGVGDEVGDDQHPHRPLSVPADGANGRLSLTFDIPAAELAHLRLDP